MSHYKEQLQQATKVASTTHTLTFGATATSGNLLMSALVVDKDAGTITIPTGWTQRGTLMTGTGVSFAVATKVSNGTETNADWSWTNSEMSAVAFIEVSGYGTIEDTKELDSTSTTVTSLACPTTGTNFKNDTIELVFFGMDSGANGENSVTYSNNFHEILGESAGVGGEPGLWIAERVFNTLTGAACNRTWTTADEAATIGIALNPNDTSEAFQFHQSSPIKSNSASTSINPVLPATATAGNLLLVVAAIENSSGGINALDGFTTIVDTDLTDVSLYMGYKIAAGGEQTLALSINTSQNIECAVFEYAADGAISLVGSNNDDSGGLVVQTLGTNSVSASAGDLICAFHVGDSVADFLQIDGDDGGNKLTGDTTIREHNIVSTGGAEPAFVFSDRTSLTTGGSVSATFTTQDTGNKMVSAIAVFKSGGIIPIFQGPLGGPFAGPF